MNPPVVTTIGHVDPNAAPLTINELIDLLNTTIASEITGSYIPYIIQKETPGVDDRDKAWIELDSAGRPIALKIWFAGSTAAWRRVYNGMIGEIRGYFGNPGLSDDANADFDVNGHGHIGGRYDGWQLCNGKNGSPDFSDKFFIGGHMNNNNGHNGYDNGWQTFVDGVSDLKTGGVADKLITSEFLPPLDNSNPGEAPGLWAHGKEAKEAEDHSPNTQILVDTHFGNATSHSVLMTNYGSNPNGNPPVPQKNFPTLPPFICGAWITFQGY